VPPKRSPILGYNHNVRHRGVVFHVQTEDSGVDNPHLFTHLFNGGVIISTRRLDYDRDASEDVVKSLMQSQHKAILKELKGGAFDEKIDRYLGDLPGLEPRSGGAAPDTAVTQPVLPVVDTRSTQDMAPIRAADAPLEIVEENSDVTIRIELEPGSERPRRDTLEAGFDMPAVEAPPLSAATQSMPPARTAGTPPPARASTTAAPGAVPPPPATARTLGFGSAMLGAPARSAPGTVPAPSSSTRASQPSVPQPGGRPDEARKPPGSVEFRPPTGDYPRPRPAEPAPPTRVEFKKSSKSSDSEVTAAFNAIRVNEEGEVEPTAPVAPAPAAAPRRDTAAPQPVRDADSSGMYIHTRTGRHSIVPERIEDDPTNRTDAIPRSRSGGVAPARSQGGGPPARPASAPAQASPASGEGSAPRSRRAAEVIVSKSSVIVGAPTRVIGQPSRAPDPRQTAPRRARESVKPGLFGKDLISEKSLDEVILAYLSEDGEDSK
jgi:hypothetical protein